MPEAQITNPMGALRTTSDFIDGWDASSENHLYFQRVISVRANAAITLGEALMFVSPTATVPLSVTPMTAAITGSDPWSFAGAALEAAAAGDLVRVLVDGIARVRIDAADTAAALSILLAPDTTTGRFAVATDPAAGDVVVGYVLGIEDASGTADFALARVGYVPVLTVVNT